MTVLGQAHTLLHEQGIVRIQTDIRVGTRYVLAYLLSLPSEDSSRERVRLIWASTNSTDKHQVAADKVASVEKLLARDGKKEDV